MKCLLSYQWVKLRRSHLPTGKGVMGAWLRLAARAAFRKGKSLYCGYQNDVEPGSWVGGIIGLKSILGIKDKKRALAVMDELVDLGYITYSLDPKTKVLSYHITDWVLNCAGEACLGEAVYATDGYGFLCIPRNVTQRLVDSGYRMQEADAWLDLWCHTVWHQKTNAFSGLSPIVQFEYSQPILTLEYLGKRWNWEKTKVWRFLQKYSDTFLLYKLPGSFGCLIFTSTFPTLSGGHNHVPTHESVMRILNRIRILAAKARFEGTDHQRLNRIVVCMSKKVSIFNLNEGLPSKYHPATNCRVALSPPYYNRAYFSQVSSCQSCYLCSIDCHRNYASTYRERDNYWSHDIEEDYHVRKDKKAIRAAGKPAFNPINGFHALSGPKGASQRYGNQKPRGSQGQAGTTKSHVPQHRIIAEALSQYQMGAGMFPGQRSGRSGGAI